MIDLDTSQLPQPIVTALMLRGADLPPIRWDEHPNRAGKTALDQMTDWKKLFGLDEVRDESMAAAVQAMLYLWNGWPDAAEMYAKLAPERERCYIDGIRHRQAGETDASKDAFTQVNGHPIFSHLALYASDTIGLSTTPLLKRLRDMIAFGEQWEPFAFGDVYEQARDGRLDPTGEQIVRSLQCREFELLFAYCYEAATGEKLVGKKPEAAPARRPPPKRPAPKRQPQKPQDEGPPNGGSPEVEKKLKAAMKPITSSGVEVLCPKCREINSFKENARGSKGRCKKCSALFLIPKRSSAANTAG
jgi:hypothetical protein